MIKESVEYDPITFNPLHKCKFEFIHGDINEYPKEVIEWVIKDISETFKNELTAKLLNIPIEEIKSKKELSEKNKGRTEYKISDFI